LISSSTRLVVPNAKAGAAFWLELACREDDRQEVPASARLGDEGEAGCGVAVSGRVGNHDVVGPAGGRRPDVGQCLAG